MYELLPPELLQLSSYCPPFLVTGEFCESVAEWYISDLRLEKDPCGRCISINGVSKCDMYGYLLILLNVKPEGDEGGGRMVKYQTTLLHLLLLLT